MSGRSNHRICTVLISAMVLALTAALLAEQPPPKKPEPGAYGKTPDTVIPFRNFKHPYARFFQNVAKFRGARRNDVAGGHADSIRIGYFGPTGSAPDADLGAQMLEGVTLAIEQANALGGYEGRPFELVERADTGLWGAASNEMVGFTYEDHVLGVIGSIDGANSHIALRVALKTQMPMVNTATTDPTLTETAIPWLVRCMADDRQQGYALAHHVFTECGLEKVVAFRSNDRFGRMGIAEFRDAAVRLGHPLRRELRWQPGDRDFDLQLDFIAQSDAEAIVLWGNAADTAEIVREIRKREMPLRIFGCDRLAGDAFLEAAGRAAEGVVAVASYDPTRQDPRLREFNATFTARFHHQPNAFAAHAFDGANILIAAIREAGLNRIRIRDALHKLTHHDGATGLIEFDTTLNDIGTVYIATIQDGSFVYEEATFAQRLGAAPEPVPHRRLSDSAPVPRSPQPMPTEDGAAYRLGCFLPLDAAGQAVVRGVQMALADDAARHPNEPRIELLVRDARGAWGEDSGSLVELVSSERVLALIGSTERRGTHLAEMLAAKLHFPIVTLCDGDPTVTQIPLPWMFNVAPAGDELASDFSNRFGDGFSTEAVTFAALGYDAGALLASAIRAGGRDRLTLRNALAADTWNHGVTGIYRFDALGNRISPQQVNQPSRPASSPPKDRFGAMDRESRPLPPTAEKGLRPNDKERIIGS